MSATVKCALSLGARLLVGAALWTVGLLALARRSSPAMVVIQGPAACTGAGRPWPIVVALAVSWSAGFSQVRSGLRRWRSCAERLAGVHAGARARLDGAYPSEVQPLVDDLNALLDQRDRRRARALASAGDLAHGLKTPLAVIAHEADRAAAAGPASSPNRSLSRWSACSARSTTSSRTRVPPPGVPRSPMRASRVVDGLVRTLARLHADASLEIDVLVTRR